MQYVYAVELQVTANWIIILSAAKKKSVLMENLRCQQKKKRRRTKKKKKHKGLHVECSMLNLNKRMFACSWPLDTIWLN